MKKKLLSELPMMGFGGGVAVAGASLVAIGIYGAKKNVINASLTMTIGAIFAHFGTQVTIGAVERVRELQ